MGLRRDAHKIGQLREIHISFDGLARVDGSARFGFGDTNVALSSVSGPIEVRLSSEHPSHATFEVSTRPLSNVPSTESKAFASTIRSILEPSLILSKCPRTLIQLVVQTLSPAHGAWREGLLAAMINSSTLALLNAGSVPMRGVVCAVSVGRLGTAPSSTLIVDPTDDETASLTGGGCFAFVFAHAVGSDDSECVWSNWKTAKGAFDAKELIGARELARDAVRQVYTAMRESVVGMGTGLQPGVGSKQIEERKLRGAAVAYEDGEDDDSKMEI